MGSMNHMKGYERKEKLFKYFTLRLGKLFCSFIFSAFSFVNNYKVNKIVKLFL